MSEETTAAQPTPAPASKDRKRRTKAKKGFDLPFIVFVASLMLLSMGYGMAAMRWHWPPATQVLNAQKAFEALGLMEDETLAASVNAIDENAPPTPVFRTLDPAAGKELLLVTGGPNQDAKNCPQFGCLAWLIDRSGRTLHAWPMPLEALFKDAKGISGHTDLRNFYPVGMQLMNDGSIVATFHARNTFPYTVGLARIDWDGKVMWKQLDGAHHWLHILPDGRIAAPIQVAREMKSFGRSKIEMRCDKLVYDEGVRIYGADGKPQQTVMLIDVLLKNGYPGLLYGLRDDCDPIHVNSVDVVTPGIAANIPGSAVGDILVSLREPSAIALIEPATGKIRHLVAGRTAAQHSARFLPDGTVVAFDNQGGDSATGGSRILRINFVDGSLQTVFPTAQSKSVLPFYSPDGSNVAVSPDGKRLMISVKDESRDIEVDVATGRPLWTYKHVMDIGPFMRDDKKPVAGTFKAYGTYYVPAEQARLLPLR